MSKHIKSKVISYSFFLLSITFLIFTLLLTASSPETQGVTALGCWLVSIIFATYFVIKMQQGKDINHQKERVLSNYKEILLILILLLLSFAYLIKDINTLPFVVHGDEAEQAVNAKTIVESKPFNMFMLGWYDIPYPSFILNVPALRIFGDNLFGLRITSVIEGVLTIFITYLIARLVIGSKLFAAITSITLLTTPTFTHFARSGASYMQATMAVTAAIYFFLKALDNKKNYVYVYLAGLTSGFGFLLYYAGRVAFFIILLSIPISLFTRKISFKQILIFLFGFCIIVAPFTPVWLKNPESFNSRTSQVLIFNQWKHVTDGKINTPVFEVLGKQIYSTLNFFITQPDKSEQFGIQNGGFTLPLTTFLILGIMIFVVKIFRDSNYVLLLWFFSCIGAVIVTVDAPFAPRLASITPVVAIITISSIRYISSHIFEVFSRFTYKVAFIAKASLTTTATAFIVFSGMNKYYVSYKSDQPENAYTVIGRYLAQNASNLDQKQVCIITGQGLLAKYSTFVLLAPNAKIKIVDSDSNGKGCEAYIFNQNDEEKMKTLAKGKHLRNQNLKNHDGRELFKSLVP